MAGIGRNYKIGREIEYRAMELLQSPEYRCIYVTRSAGSHSLFDVFGVNLLGKIYLIQCKRTLQDCNLESKFKKDLQELKKFRKRLPSDCNHIKIGLWVWVYKKGWRIIWL